MSSGGKIPDSQSRIIDDLKSHVDELSLSEDVLNLLLPNGSPHAFETMLWDYKEKLPFLPERPTEEERKTHKAEIGDIIKDVVSFHNSFGGYILFGVSERGTIKLRSVAGELDCGDLNKRIQSYTDASIECMFRKLPFNSRTGSFDLGLLLIPRRSAQATPVRFRKEGPEKPSGGRSFNKETYVRVRDECRPAASTSEDWTFLHSPRNPPGVKQHPQRRRVRSSLPARDPDLLEFVGREDALTSLRSWLTDIRSPIRLITGIGGLGKTSLAFRFAEEVIDAGAGELDSVIWLTAKERTFSALRGRMVATTRVDFSDLLGIYKEILRFLSHEIELELDEPTLDEYFDRVYEALSIVPSLIIVDDIDSLAPDVQKEVVAALNSLAQRTVGRELPPSRILLTSRIDQGLPQTSVIKISGLSQPDFEKHLKNLCDSFRIQNIYGDPLKDLFSATSGSPLFAASIVRLVSLGESLRTVIDTWKGQDGEDVRRFAFEREIKRLDVIQAKILYAVLLLGETSVSDIAGILEITVKIVRDKISELQAFQLLATNISNSGDASIVAPNDLISITNILKANLGATSSSVEIACARAEERSKSDNRSIGLQIRLIIRAWEEGKNDEAVVLASELRNRSPNSGDVLSILGAALLRLTPARSAEAERALLKARELGCTRPELLPNLIRAKRENQDWLGIYNLTKDLTSNESGRDIPLSAYIEASRELLNAAKSRGDWRRGAEISLEAVERISAKISRQRIEIQFFNFLKDCRFDFSREYIQALDRTNNMDGDRLSVFAGVYTLSENDVILIDLLRQGVEALRTWWTDVERRPVVDLVACGILGKQLRRLERMKQQLVNFNANAAIIAEISNRIRDLAHRGAKLSSNN